MLAATPTLSPQNLDATALRRGGLRLLPNSNKRKSPRDKPVASIDIFLWGVV
jgi:hypothetical protein